MPIGKAFTVEKKKKYVHAIAFKVDDEGLFKLDNAFELLRVKGKRRSDKMRDFIVKVSALLNEYTKLSEENKRLSKLLKRQERTIKSLNKQLEGLSQVTLENKKLKREVAKLTEEKKVSPSRSQPRVAKSQPTKREVNAPQVVKPISISQRRPTRQQAKKDIRQLESIIKTLSESEKPEIAKPQPTYQQDKKAIQIDDQPKESLKEGSQLIWCPYKEEWIHSIRCDQCKLLRFRVFQDCQERRVRNSNDPIFKPSKPKPILPASMINEGRYKE